MESQRPSLLTRRSFIGGISCLLASGGLIAATGSSARRRECCRNLWDEFTPEEQETIDKSAMAQDIGNFAGQGYSCAESIFMVSLRYLGKPEEMVNAAAGYGGGLGHYELCGLLTGGVMGIGVSAGMIYEDRKELGEHVKKTVREYWDWWEQLAPLHCYQLEPKYTGLDEYLTMCKRVAAKVEELIKPAKI